MNMEVIAQECYGSEQNVCVVNNEGILVGRKVLSGTTRFSIATSVKKFFIVSLSYINWTFSWKILVIVFLFCFCFRKQLRYAPNTQNISIIAQSTKCIIYVHYLSLSFQFVLLILLHFNFAISNYWFVHNSS